MVILRIITLIYIFFSCISYNLEWFYLVGSFGYADLLLPLLLLADIKYKKIKIDAASFLLFGLAVLSCASLFFAASSGQYDNINVGYFFRSLYFLGLYALILNSDIRAETISKTILISLMFSLVLCFYIWSTNPRYFGYSSIPMLHILESPSGLTVNRNESGLTACLAYGLSLYALLYRRFFSRRVNFILVTISLLTVALSFSKGAWLLGLIASFLMILFRVSITRFIGSTIFVIVAMSFLPLSEIAFMDAVISRFSNSSETNAYRLSYIIDSIIIGTDNFLFGIGPGNYQEYTFANGYTVTIDPHNSYLQTFAELGAFGFMIVSVFYLLGLVQSYLNAKKDIDHIVIFILIVMLIADGFQSGLSLTMKILYILVAVTMREVLNGQRQA